MPQKTNTKYKPFLILAVISLILVVIFTISYILTRNSQKNKTITKAEPETTSITASNPITILITGSVTTFSVDTTVGLILCKSDTIDSSCYQSVISEKNLDKEVDLTKENITLPLPGDAPDASYNHVWAYLRQNSPPSYSSFLSKHSILCNNITFTINTDNVNSDVDAVCTEIITPAKVTLTSEEKVYTSFDFLRGYLDPSFYAKSIHFTPWTYSSVNLFEMRSELGGTMFWDYFSNGQKWDDSDLTIQYHGWQDDSGNWHSYKKENNSYILVDRNGPGILDTIQITQFSLGALDMLDSFGFGSKNLPKDFENSGDLQLLGNLRIEVDENTVYDGPIIDWFSRKASSSIPDDLRKYFFWYYREFGSNGSIIPIPYKDHLRISTYGGVPIPTPTPLPDGKNNSIPDQTMKPLWFMIRGVNLPPDVKIKSFANSQDDLPPDSIKDLIQNIINPEHYIDRMNINNGESTQEDNLYLNPSASIRLDGSGTVKSLQFNIPTSYNVKNLTITVDYGGDIGINLPLIAMLGDQDSLPDPQLNYSSLTNTEFKTTPLGIIKKDNSYIFYNNYPMPYQNGITITLSTADNSSISIPYKILLSKETFNTQLRIKYDGVNEHPKMQAYSDDYKVKIQGSGRLVGLTVTVRNHDVNETRKIKPVYSSVWPLGFMEGNVILQSGDRDYIDFSQIMRIFDGLEDFADGGYYFNDRYKRPPGGSNRVNSGIFNFELSDTGFASLFNHFTYLSSYPFTDGLNIFIQHGNWKNNFPVSYGTTAYYYKDL